MQDDALARLDEAFGRKRPVTERPSRPRPTVLNAAAAEPAPVPLPVTAPRRIFRERWHLIELFLIAQFCASAVLFIPGTQSVRPVVRALPYLSSAAMLVFYFSRHIRKRPPAGTMLLMGALGLLGLNLLRPTSQLYAGLAQCAFQASIAAPLFWAWKGIEDAARLRRVLHWIFALNAVAASVGILQAYFPDVFLPPEFSTLGLRLNEYFVDALTYVGADGRLIVRPPGLSDLPGGAAIAGFIAALLGVGLSLDARGPVAVLRYLVPAAVGFAVIYLTQVRSLLLMAIVGVAVIGATAIRQGRLGAGLWALGGGGLLVVGGFAWALTVGGKAIESRFMGIAEAGAIEAYEESRGHFLSYTLTELVDQFPLGAGVGRWGMMNVYFGDPNNVASQPIYVEIQLTGWLLDGGVPMWALYGGAVLLALLASYRLTIQRRSREVASLAAIVLGMQVAIVGMGMVGPVFNMQMGLLFWFLAAALHGAWVAFLPPRRSGGW